MRVTTLIKRDFEEFFQDKLCFQISKSCCTIMITLCCFAHRERIFTAELIKYLSRRYGCQMTKIDPVEETCTMVTFKWSEEHFNRLQKHHEEGYLSTNRYDVIKKIEELSKLG